MERALTGEGKLLFDNARLDKARAEQQRLAVELRLLDVLLNRAHQHLVAVIGDMADTILRDHLRPSFDRVIGEARKLAPALEGAVTPEAVLKRGDNAVKTWNRLERLDAEYLPIRAAWAVLFRESFRDDVQEGAERFAEFENFASLWPTYHRERPDQAPWPQHGVARLAWLIDHGAAFWLPTPEDLNRALGREQARMQDLQRAGRQRWAAVSV